MFAEIISILSPVFACAGIGYFWARSGRTFDTQFVTAIVTYFGTPCLVFSTLAVVELNGDTLVKMGAAAVAANLFFTIFGALVLKLSGLSQRTFLQALTWPNVGNVGLPLCYLAFGEEGLALAVAFFAVYVVLQMTIGVAFVSGDVSLKSLQKMPIVPATVLAVLFLATGTEVPRALYNTTKLIGDLTIPLMLITLGVSLASLHVSNLKRSFYLSMVRFSMGLVGGMGLVALFGFEGKAAGVVILQCAMPSAVFCYLFAQMYNRQPAEVAGLVVTSTAMAIPLLPVLLWYVL
jgi:predicted permease